MEEQDVGHVYIPAHIMARKDLTLTQKMLFGKIVGLSGKEGYCFASNDWLGKQLGKKADTISGWIGKLVTMGLLERVLIYNEKKEIVKRKLFPKWIEVVGEGLPLEKEETHPIGIGEIADRGIGETAVGIQENYIQEKRVLGASIKNSGVPRRLTPPPHLEKDPANEEIQEYLEVFNTTYGTKYRNTSSFQKNFLFWRKIYSLEEILRAIKRSPNVFWASDPTPELILRTRNKSGECDYIGQILNTKSREQKELEREMEGITIL